MRGGLGGSQASNGKQRESFRQRLTSSHHAGPRFLVAAAIASIAVAAACSPYIGAPSSPNQKLRPDFTSGARVALSALVRTREDVYGSETAYQLHLVNSEADLDKLEASGPAESQLLAGMRSYHDLIKIERAAIQQRAEISNQGLSLALAHQADELVREVDAHLDGCEKAVSDLLEGATLKANPCLQEPNRVQPNTRKGG